MERNSETLMDHRTLSAALVGLEAERNEIDQRISQIQTQLRIQGATNYGQPNVVNRTQANEQNMPARRRISPAGLKRIRAAQQKRWAEVRKRQKQVAHGGKTTGAGAR